MGLEKIKFHASGVVRKYLKIRYGKHLFFTKHDLIGKKFHELIEAKKYARFMYRANEGDMIAVSVGLYRKPSGFYLNRAATYEFNTFVENYFFDLANEFIYSQLVHVNSVRDAILNFMHRYDLEDSDISYDTLKKRYYRFEKRNDLQKFS